MIYILTNASLKDTCVQIGIAKSGIEEERNRQLHPHLATTQNP